MKRSTILILLLLMLAACQSPAQEVPVDASQGLDSVMESDDIENSDAAAQAETPPETVLEKETPLAVITPAPQDPVISTSEPPAAQPAPDIPETTKEEPHPTEAPPPTEAPLATFTPVVNGVFDSTYFRGAESAPVTMIDYSDFL